MVRTKRGDVAGYASELIMVPELKLGIVVLASMVEHAQYTAQLLTGVLLPAFDAALRTSVSPGPRPPPSPTKAYIGMYKIHGVPDQSLPETLNITLSASGELLFDWIQARLEFVGTEGADVHLFRMVPWWGRAYGPAAPTCTDTQTDDWCVGSYDWFKFLV